MMMRESETGFEEKVPFGDRVELFMGKKVEGLWDLIKRDEVDFPKFAFKVGMEIINKYGPETMLKFLEKNELKDKELVQKLGNEARSRMERR